VRIVLEALSVIGQTDQTGRANGLKLSRQHQYVSSVKSRDEFRLCAAERNEMSERKVDRLSDEQQQQRQQQQQKQN
jgi:hypothetical protein